MVWAAALAVLPLRAAQPELLYAVNFDDPAVRAAVDKCPFAKVEKDFEGTSVLTVTVPPDKMSDGNPVAVVIPIDIEKIGAAGGFANRVRALYPVPSGASSIAVVVSPNVLAQESK